MARTTDERSDDTPLHPTPRNTNPRRPSGGSDLLNVATELSTPAVAQPNTVASDIPIPVKASVEEAPAAVEIRGDRLISGIDLIDFGAGGLIPQKLYVVKGAQGLGKSILGLQFLSRGLEHGEPGILVTDQRPANVIEQAKALGFPIEDAVRRNQLVILNPSQRYFELVESPADVLAIIEELGDYARTAGSRRLVVDPVFTLINTSYSSHFALAITQSLVNALEDLPVTTLLLTGDGGPELNGIVRILEQNAFGVIDLSNDPETGGRMMRLTKLRYANTDHLAAHYRILDGRGLINYRGEGEQVVDVTQPWEETGATSRKVLILGARPETIRRVREALGDSYEVEAEADLKAGVERVKRDRPGLVLVTPSRNAGAIGAILDLAQNASSSIAFLSPTANRQSDKVLYLRAGADDFITEPFTPAEFRARTEALVRRSGRRLKMRDSTLASITPEQLNSLMNAGEGEHRQKGPAILSTDNQLSFEPEFQDRLHRNLEIVSKFEQPFALYWMKGQENDAELGRDLAKLCRQEDVVCHNRRGEFVAILTATDQHGLRGFENRLRERLGDRLDRPGIRRGHVLHEPGQPLDEIAARAFQN